VIDVEFFIYYGHYIFDALSDCNPKFTSVIIFDPEGQLNFIVSVTRKFAYLHCYELSPRFPNVKEEKTY
jgi:hypothetical protein